MVETLDLVRMEQHALENIRAGQIYAGGGQKKTANGAWWYRVGGF